MESPAVHIFKFCFWGYPFCEWAHVIFATVIPLLSIRRHLNQHVKLAIKLFEIVIITIMCTTNFQEPTTAYRKPASMCDQWMYAHVWSSHKHNMCNCTRDRCIRAPTQSSINRQEMWTILVLMRNWYNHKKAHAEHTKTQHTHTPPESFS